MRRSIPALCLTTLALLATGLPAVAAPVLVSANDPSGDVRLTKAVGLSPKARRSIDIRALTVVDRGDTVRFSLTVRDVLAPPAFAFDQIATISLSPADAAATWASEISMSPQEPKDGLAYYFVDAATAEGTAPGDAQCNRIRVKVAGAKNRFSIDVPEKCLPDGAAVITVKTLISAYRSDALPVFSKDTLRVAGSYDLR